MRNYEVAYIADPELDESSLQALEVKVLDWIKDAGGKPGEIDRWGKRRLAYPINRKTDGHYVFILAELPPEGGQPIERELGLSEQIMRFLITLQEIA